MLGVDKDCNFSSATYYQFQGLYPWKQVKKVCPTGQVGIQTHIKRTKNM